MGTRNPEDYFNHFNDTIEPFEPEMLSRGPFIRENSEIKDYYKLGSRWYNALIRAYKAENVKIIGEKGSLIDGMDCYDELGEEAYRGPHAICFIKCSNVYLSGYEIVNSSNWAHSMWYCNNLELSYITVNAGHDGCHFRRCNNIYIHNSVFSTGDDCIAGYNNRNMAVENCELNTACSAFRLGATNVLIQNCHAYGPPKHLMRYVLSQEDKIAGVHDVPKDREWNYMLSFYTYYASVNHYTKDNPGNENVLIRNCKVENADRFLHYNFSGNEPWQSGSPLLDIKFENANFAAYLKVVKVDSETGKTIPYAGAAFEIYNPQGELVEMTTTYPNVVKHTQFKTNAEGYLITPEVLEYGLQYSIVEVSAPYGYVLDQT